MSRLLSARALLERVPFSLVQLACRFAIAGVFLRAGLQKFSGWETTIALFTNEYKVPLLPPEIAASMSAVTEVGCSILLVLLVRGAGAVSVDRFIGYWLDRCAR